MNKKPKIFIEWQEKLKNLANMYNNPDFGFNKKLNYKPLKKKKNQKRMQNYEL
jgi:hypothetical protein